jgi:hypothetical protein
VAKNRLSGSFKLNGRLFIAENASHDGKYQVLARETLTKGTTVASRHHSKSNHRIYLPCSPGKRELEFRGDFRRV